MYSKILFTLALTLLYVSSPLVAQDQINLERAWSFEEHEWLDPISTRLVLYANQPGRLVLLDHHNKELRQEQGNPVWLVFVWQMENQEEIPDQLFYVNFTPEEGSGPAFQRLLRVTPGDDVHFLLVKDHDQWIWRSTPSLPREISLQSLSENDDSAAPSVWMSVEAIDDELDTFWQLLNDAGIAEPELIDVAEDIKSQGFALMGDGLYAEALLMLQQSYKIEPTSELLDRIKRLEAYIDLQIQ